jgi:hypothetical protein
MRRMYVLITACCLLASCRAFQHQTICLDVLAQPQVEMEYFQKMYGTTYRIPDMTLASRSENRWNWTCKISQGKCKKLIRQLEADTNVIRVQILDSIPNPPTNSTNSHFHKTQPINNQ